MSRPGKSTSNQAGLRVFQDDVHPAGTETTGWWCCLPGFQARIAPMNLKMCKSLQALTRDEAKDLLAFLQDLEIGEIP